METGSGRAVYTTTTQTIKKIYSRSVVEFSTNDQKLLDIGGTILHNKGSDKQKKGGKYEKNLRIKLWGCYSF